MSRRRITKSARTLAHLVTGVLFIPFAARTGTVAGSYDRTGIGFAYDAAKDQLTQRDQ
jgi:hypothetical protein